MYWVEWKGEEEGGGEGRGIRRRTDRLGGEGMAWHGVGGLIDSPSRRRSPGLWAMRSAGISRGCPVLLWTLRRRRIWWRCEGAFDRREGEELPRR